MSQPNINLAVNIRNSLEQEKAYAMNIGSNQFNILDTNDSIVIDPSGVNYNSGFHERQKLTNQH